MRKAFNSLSSSKSISRANLSPMVVAIVKKFEVLVIVLVVLLFFGGKKIPELMKGLGKGVRSFKDGMNDIEKDIKDTDKDK